MGKTIITDSPRFVKTPFLPICDSQFSLYTYIFANLISCFLITNVFFKIQRNFYSRPAPAVQVIPVQVPMENYQFQLALQYLPPYQPTIQPQQWSDSSSLKTFSDIESYMTFQKLKDMPHWKPNQYQQMPTLVLWQPVWKWVPYERNCALERSSIAYQRYQTQSGQNSVFYTSYQRLLTTQNQAMQRLLSREETFA